MKDDLYRNLKFIEADIIDNDENSKNSFLSKYKYKFFATCSSEDEITLQKALINLKANYLNFEKIYHE